MARFRATGTDLVHRVLTRAVPADPETALPDRPGPHDFVSPGRRTAFLTRRRGEWRWVDLRFGLEPRGSDLTGLLTRARLDQLERVERWARLVNSRCALPLAGYRWSRDGEWMRVAPCWAPGFFEEEDGGAAIALLAEGGGAPLLLGEQATLEWLAAPQWDVVPMLREAAAVAC